MAPYNETSANDYTPADVNVPVSMLEYFAPAPKGETLLSQYRLLSPSAGVRVSPLCLGAMSLGDQWSPFMGGKDMGLKESMEFLDVFYELGGNFIDTANNYQDEQSEFIVGEWMKARGNRDDIVLATKYTSPYKIRKEGRYPGIGVNYIGNSKKSLKHSVEDSLRKLQTDYIDLLYVHWWDHSTDIPELMQSLNDLVRSGKVLYLGISDTPAWIVSAANEYARAHGLAQFVVFQGLWNLKERDIERDIIPMCRKYGMALAPWGVIGQGKFKTPEQIKEAKALRGNTQPTEAEIKASEALAEVAAEIGNGASIAAVAMAWSRSKMAYCIPIIGGTKVSHLRQNARDLSITLTAEQIAKLEAACPFDHGFPTGRFGRDPHYLPNGKPESIFVNVAGDVKFVTGP